MMKTFIPFVCLILLAPCTLRAADAASPLSEWLFDADHVNGQSVKAAAGTLGATIVGPVKFAAEEPQALLLSGDSKAGHRISVTDDIAAAALPPRAISAEAWVWIDKPLEWGGIVGAMQDNGDYEKGWLLGYCHSQFCFAVASKAKRALTYLKTQSPFQTGCWYHVVGTYDGNEQRIYVDGRLQGSSREQRGDIDYPPKAFYTIAAYRDDNELYSMAGRLARVCVFDKALTAQQVAARFQEGQARFPGIMPVRPVVTDWPTCMRDWCRTGQSTERLPFPLTPKWVYKGAKAPRPGWAEEAKNNYYKSVFGLAERVTYDRVFHVVGVGGMLCFASSADDKVYCLDADTGRERWAFYTEGPVRAAPVIAGDRVVFGSDDGFAYALNAADGALVWKRRLAPGPRRIAGNERVISAWPVRTDVLVEDNTGYMCAGIFPSQGVFQYALDLRDGAVLQTRKLDVTAQGYLRRSAGQLYVPTGRAPGGAHVAALSSQGKDPWPEASSLPKEYPFACIGAGNTRIGGGDGKIAAFGEDGREIWSAAVDGRAYSLAIVGGRLLASTDKGVIHCFAVGKDAGAPAVVSPPAPLEPAYPDAALKERYSQAADAIIKQAQTERGYCLVLGSGDGWLVYELARRTNWQVIGREPEAEKAARSRRILDAAGLAGRAVIHHGPLDPLPYTDCLFNVVTGDFVAGALAGPRAEAQRVLRPDGGVAVFGPAAGDIVRRAPLDGAGEWTHFYGTPANTACSGDTVVTGDRTLLLQWFGRPGPRTMIDRHHRTVAPLYKAGRLFVPGEDRVTAVDAYNGTVLWEAEVPNSRRVVAFRDCSYLALAADALYVAAPESCLAFNPQTGKQERAFSLPPFPQGKLEWGYIAAIGDLLLGSGVKPGSSRRQQSHQLTVTETHWDCVPAVGSDLLFAQNRRDGTTLWNKAAQSGLIINPTIVSDGRALCFVESANPETLKKPVGRAKLTELVGKGANVTALELQTGKELWSKPAGELANTEHNLFSLCAQDRLVLVGSRNSGANKKTDKVVYEIHAYDMRTGEKTWFRSQTQSDPIGGEHGEQERHPLVVGGTLYCEPCAYDLLTGNAVEWKWPWKAKSRRGCGTISASSSCLFVRNENIALFDLATSQTRKVTTETRPGCWINTLPAGGLLLVPEASSGCTCDFAVQASLAFIPAAQPGKQ